MYTQGKKWLLDTHHKTTADRIPYHITELNYGKSSNVFYGKEIVGEVITARNMNNKVCVEILWYDVKHPSPKDSTLLEKYQCQPTDCYIGLFKILGEYDEKKSNI